MFLSQSLHKLSIDTHIIGVHSTNHRSFTVRMTYSKTIFFNCLFLRQIAVVRVHTIKYVSIKDFFPRIPKLSSVLKSIYWEPNYGSSNILLYRAFTIYEKYHPIFPLIPCMLLQLLHKAHQH